MGSLAIAPTQPETLYVGMGEPNFSIDSFFGVGLYRIENASTTADLNGPFTLNESSVDVFSGSSISKIVVHPTDPDTIFVSSTFGYGGIRSESPETIPPLGLYRSTSATSASPSFTKIGFPASVDVRDFAIDPLDPNILVMSIVTSPGGIYRLTDALAPVPSMVTKVFSLPCTSLDDCTAEVASQRSPTTPVATFYAAGVGGVARSVDGGATWAIMMEMEQPMRPCSVPQATLGLSTVRNPELSSRTMELPEIYRLRVLTFGKNPSDIIDQSNEQGDRQTHASVGGCRFIPANYLIPS